MELDPILEALELRAKSSRYASAAGLGFLIAALIKNGTISEQEVRTEIIDRLPKLKVLRDTQEDTASRDSALEAIQKFLPHDLGVVAEVIETIIDSEKITGD